MATQTIIKFLTAAGAGSRRRMTEAIKAGLVAVNGNTVESFTQPVDEVTDTITISGKRVTPKTGALIYLLVNKPKGIVSTTSDDRGSSTVLDILPPKYKGTRLYPVGRLDKDSTGLMLLTNDGDFTYLLTHPKFEREKEYLVHVNRTLTIEDVTRLEKGVYLEDGKTAPAKIKAVKATPFNYSITIHEGRNRQVRRMFASLGYRVLELKRIRLDTLTIAGLPEGAVRELTPREIQGLKARAE